MVNGNKSWPAQADYFLRCRESPPVAKAWEAEHTRQLQSAPRGAKWVEEEMRRREILKGGTAAAWLSLTGCSRPAGGDKWDRGSLNHLLPLVSHEALTIKFSFDQPARKRPLLRVDGQAVECVQTDSLARFWAASVSGLEPDRHYELQIEGADGQPLCGTWPLKTFPAPEAATPGLSVAFYTCAGGPDWITLPGGRHAFKPAAYRRAALEQLLSHQPTLVVSNGDQIYWDYRSWIENRKSRVARLLLRAVMSRYGSFDEGLPVRGTRNEQTLTAVADEQIAGIYGVAFRSTPVAFITDDHDYFDNDDATPEIVTFPPNPFHRDLRDVVQDLYLPEFFSDPSLPESTPGLVRRGGVGLSRYFGALRVGNRLAALCYDCGGMLSLNGDEARLFPAVVEQWLMARTAVEDTQHLAHCPSTPMGWTAGKWREWYPDLVESTGTLVRAVNTDAGGGKYLWQRGWWLQHQRLLRAIMAQQHRKPLMISGDLHLLGAGRILRSGDVDCSAASLTTILSGPLGTGDVGWLSAARGLQARVPEALAMEEIFPPAEMNGFTIAHFDDSGVHVELFGSNKSQIDPDTLAFKAVARFDV